MSKKILKWLFTNNNRGVSSKAMASIFLGMDVRDSYDYGYGNHPSDPSDFNRCLGLLREAPHCRKHLHKMAEVSKVCIKRLEAEGLL